MTRTEGKVLPCSARDLAKMVLSDDPRLDELVVQAKVVLEDFPEKYLVTVEGGELSAEAEDNIREWLNNGRRNQMMITGPDGMRVKLEGADDD